LITIVLSLVISHSFRKDLLDREWRITADYVRTEALAHLTPLDFADPRSETARQHFLTFYTKTVSMPEIVRVKVYDGTTMVVWSDEPRLVGERFPDNPHVQAAISGRTIVNFEGEARKGENLYEGREFPNLVEVYVPIVFPGASAVAGVVETYKQPAEVFANIRRSRLTIAATALAGGAFLYASLFWIVRMAGRRIDEQHAALEQRNRELRDIQGQLVEAERMAAIGEVVTAVAHGIRNPLANIRAAAQVAALDETESGRPRSRHLASVMGEVDRLDARLKELFQLVRPAERRDGVVDVNAVLRGALDLMAGRIAMRGLTVSDHRHPQLPAIRGDAILLEQTFLSLIGNAIEAIPEGRPGVITLRTGTRDDPSEPMVFVEVQDTGVGLAPEEASRIFEPFYTTKAQGTGLGLALARKFTQAQGGSISVESRPAAGAVFRVTLPASPAG
jgi:signal transduction histidine kinase